MNKTILYVSLLFVTSLSFAQIPANGLINNTTYAIPTVGKILHYKFDGDLLDASGNGKDATVNSGTATFVNDFEGKPAAAIDFNTLNYITGSNTANLPMDGNVDWSMSFYYKLNGSTGTNTFFEKKTNTSTTLQYSFHVGHDGTNLTTGIDSYIQGGWASTLTSYPLTTTADNWGHIVIIKNSDSLSTYNDGKKIKAIKFPWLDRKTGTNNNIKLGDTWVGSEYNGLIDDFIFYNRALTVNEVKGLSDRVTSKTCYQSVYDTIHTIVYDTVKVAVTDTLIIALVTGINNQLVKTKIKVFPNPAHDVLNISTSNTSSAYSLKIFNSTSIEVYSTILNITPTQLNISTLGSSGIYIIKIYDSNNNILETKKLIID
ncbi:MAG: hypothetical protein RL308_3345 [Bacteroidota bacterium]